MYNNAYLEEKNMFKKIMSALLALLTVASLCACASDTADDGTSNDTTSSADTTTAETTAALSDSELFAQTRASLQKEDYNGYTFTIMDRENASWGTVDVFSPEEDGDPINDAVYQRNTALEEDYNIKIAETRNTAVASAIATLVLASEDSVDLFTDGLRQLSMTLATPGYLIDWYDIPEINLDAPYWDPMIEEGLSINNKLFYSTGDISIMDNMGSWCVLFNKQFIDDFSLEDPYTLVNDGKWTIGKVHEMAKAATLDLDGDGTLGEWDQWGFLSESFNTYALWSGSGESITVKTSDDLPEMSLYNERSVSVMEKVLDLQLDTTSCITGERHSGGMVDGINPLFKMGNALFIYGGLWLVTQYRDSEVNFGIAPNPKFDEAQDRYYNTYSYSNFTAYAIPMTAGDVSRTGTITDAMAALSQYSLTPAYYVKTLEGKFFRDEESAGMIDIILATRNFDLGSVYDWGGAITMILNLYNQKSYDMASAYAGIEAKALTAIDDFIAKLGE